MRLTSFALLFTFLSLGCASRGPTPESRATLHLQMGSSLLAQGKYPQALAELLTAEELNPKDPVIQNNLGLAYFVREKYDQAEKHMRKAVQLSPKYTEAKNNLGRTLLERGLYKDALRVLEEAAQDLTYPDPQAVQANLGIAYLKTKMPRKAVTQLLAALKADPTNCRVSTYYGRALLEVEYLEKATEAFDQAILNCKNVDTDEPYYFAGLAYFRLGQREKARARLNDALEKYKQGQYANEVRDLLKLMR